MRDAAAVVSASPPSPEAAAAVFCVRLMEPGDLSFVMDSWLRSAWGHENRKLRASHVNRAERIRAGKAWFDAIRPHVRGLVAAHNVVVYVACDREQRDHIAGWLAVKNGEELRSFIKHAYRPWNVAALLRTVLEDESAGDTPRRVVVG